MSLAFACCGCDRGEVSADSKVGADAPSYERMKNPEYRKTLEERTDGRLAIQNEIAAAVKELAAEREKDPQSKKVVELEEKLRQLEQKSLEYRRQTQQIVAEEMSKETSAHSAGSAK